MKILVIGDIVVSCDLLVEAAKSLPGGEHEVVAVEWKSETRQEFQKKALNMRKMDRQQRNRQRKHMSRLVMLISYFLISAQFQKI